MRVLYFDCLSGAAGDMIVASLVDAGADFETLKSELDKLDVGGYAVHFKNTTRNGIAAKRFIVEMDETKEQPHRHLSHIAKIVEGSRLSDAVKKRTMAAFERLADAEAEAHGISREKVHFHEVGAIDAIVDIAGAMCALEMLKPDRIVCAPVPVGSGTVKCAHGIMPVPAPATANLLRGVPIAPTDQTGELTTPTGAAILTTICDAFEAMPAMTVDRIGLGAGSREGQGRPNILRAFLGQAADSALGGTINILEANLDDAPGEWVGHCISRLIAAGVRDAYCVPISMKKQRPGVVLTVLCDDTDVAKVESIIFAETSTFGIRRTRAERTMLDREMVTVNTPYGELRVKVGRRDGAIVQVAAEYEDCAAAAEKNNVALREVMQAAVNAWRETQSG